MKSGVTYKEMVDYLEPRLNRMEDKINDIQNQLNNQKLLAAVIGGVTGTISAILSPFRT